MNTFTTPQGRKSTTELNKLWAGEQQQDKGSLLETVMIKMCMEHAGRTGMCDKKKRIQINRRWCVNR